MSAITSEDLSVFVEQFKRLLMDRSSEAEVRRLSETPEGYDPAVWSALADLGVTGLIIDEAHGGFGADAVALERVMEEVGASLLCSPLLSSAILAPALIQALDDEAAKARLLPDLASGKRIATVAITGPSAGWIEDHVAIDAAKIGEDWRLTGKASFVTHAHIADVLLVLANAPDGLAIFEVDPKAAGVSLTSLPTFDHTLRLSDLDLAQVSALRLSCNRPAWQAVEEMLDLARIALAGEQAGGSKRVLDMTVDYAKNRYQFGRAIGSFQAVKHMAADLLMDSESCTSAARHAAQCHASGSDEAPSAISLAAFACADAFSTITATSIQMHGGIAFTWAHPAHLYLRRARADAQLFGSSDFYRERYVQQLGG
jgi:alkylation response protein AidB-like acyl-CoA dehydrogenase